MLTILVMQFTFMIWNHWLLPTVLFNNEEVQSPMAIKSFDLWSYGQSAYIPSVRQLSYLFAVWHQINEGITEVGGTPINLNVVPG